MKIVCDEHIPFLAEAVHKEWQGVRIYPMKPDEIDAHSVSDADVLVIRTRTQVNERLLAGSKVKLVCTATIGFDHIDTDYCESHGIRWISCPGCNAKAVCNYIEEAIDEVVPELFPDTSTLTIGIVGVGHVGSLVARMAERKGYKVQLNDPPKGFGVSLDEIAEKSDIITFHTPLDSTTYHLGDEHFFSQCKRGALIINAARGGVVDEQTLLQSGLPYVLDTWENEPNICQNVLKHALRASMHIAGYSVDGKRNASQMCLNAISSMFGLKTIDMSRYRYHGIVSSYKNSNELWLAAITSSLKASPTSFETLRKAYPLREE